MYVITGWKGGCVECHVQVDGRGGGVKEGVMAGAQFLVKNVYLQISSFCNLVNSYYPHFPKGDVIVHH